MVLLKKINNNDDNNNKNNNRPKTSLGAIGVYQKLDNDPSTLVQRVINDAISNIEERGDIDEKTLKYFMVNNPKLGRFYLLPKIHKRLSSVPGRPVISTSGCFTENI